MARRFESDKAREARIRRDERNDPYLTARAGKIVHVRGYCRHPPGIRGFASRFLGSDAGDEIPF